MKVRHFFIWFTAMFTMVVMLVSCHSRTICPWPSTRAGVIVTSAIEVEGDDEGEKLRIEFNSRGECARIFKGEDKEPQPCKGIPLEATLFCIPPEDNHPANIDINMDGTPDVYCGNVIELTDGTDIRFKAPPAAANRMCKNVGGDVICWP